MRRSILTIFSFLICLGIASPSLAASYAIAPFKINGGSGYNYLEKAIPPMFNSRLFLAGVNEPVTNQDKLLSQKAPENKTKAESARKQYNADFLVYGSVTIIGENASLDVSVVGKDTFWKKAVQTNIDSLFNAVQSISDDINHEILGREKTRAQGQNRAPSNNSIIANETSPQATSYLNPELRYQGTEVQRTRTKPLPYASYGFEIADFDNDGRDEIAVLSETEINIYKYEENQLNPIAQYKLPSAYEPLRIRSFEFNGTTHLVVSANNTSTKSAEGMLLRLSGNKIEKTATTNYYLSVASISALEKPSLIGQADDNTRFVRGAVYQMNFNGQAITRGRPLHSLPKEANVFNFTWLPGSEKEGGNHLLVIDGSDKMVTFSEEGKRLAKSDDVYASTPTGVRVTRDITGFASREGSLDVLYYYVPMRIAIADLDQNGQYEAITSKPVSTAAVILNNYRNYSQGEISAQIWDGLGMNLLWKTRRIKGTIVDVAIADPNNDGITDLVVNVNTYPGTFGVGKIRNLVLLYPLETTNIDTSAINFSE